MILLPPDSVPVNNCYKKFLWFELLGFWPSTDKYLSVSTDFGNFVPVFLGNAVTQQDYCQFDQLEWTFYPEEDYMNPPKDKWVLYFMGDDDHSTGMRFSSRESAIDWIYNCIEPDHKRIVYSEAGIKWHN